MVSALQTSQLLYVGLVAAVALERLYELRLSDRNVAAALSRGGIERGQGHFRWMRLLHVAFLVACPLEVFVLQRPFALFFGATFLALVVLAQLLRYWAIASLRGRWNVRVVLVPGEEAVRRGPYRLLRHPNYLAVIVEGFALPLLHGAWITALAFSALNAWLLVVRIRCEERALREHANYGAVFSRHGQ